MANNTRKRGEKRAIRRRRAPESFTPVARRPDARKIRNWDEFDLIMSDQDVAAIMRVSVHTVHRRVRVGLIPEPLSKYPYSWKRDEFRDWFENHKEKKRSRNFSLA